MKRFMTQKLILKKIKNFLKIGVDKIGFLWYNMDVKRSGRIVHFE